MRLSAYDALARGAFVGALDSTATTTVVDDWAAAGPTGGRGNVLAFWRRHW